MRKWNIVLYVIGEDGEDHPADCFQKVVYNLHPSFENPTQSTWQPDAFARSLHLSNLADPAFFQPSTRPLSSARTKDGVNST